MNTNAIVCLVHLEAIKAQCRGTSTGTSIFLYNKGNFFTLRETPFLIFNGWQCQVILKIVRPTISFHMLVLHSRNFTIVGAEQSMYSGKKNWWLVSRTFQDHLALVSPFLWWSHLLHAWPFLEPFFACWWQTMGMLLWLLHSSSSVWCPFKESSHQLLISNSQLSLCMAQEKN